MHVYFRVVCVPLVLPVISQFVGCCENTLHTFPPWLSPRHVPNFIWLKIVPEDFGEKRCEDTLQFE